jgi:hypothetical protein
MSPWMFLLVVGVQLLGGAAAATRPSVRTAGVGGVSKHQPMCASVLTVLTVLLRCIAVCRLR